MHAPLARLSCALFAAAWLMAPFAPSTALATRWTVDIGGGGDFTTIQAAIDQQAVEFRDTILVLPGEYAETITPPVYGPDGAKTALVSMGGAAVTPMLSITAAPAGVSRGYANIDGFTFTGAVTLDGHLPSDYPFVRCSFRGEVWWDGHGSGGTHLHISDCDFHARTSLVYFYGVARDLRFHSAPLTVSSVGGLSNFRMLDCSFEGPADTLVYVPKWSDEQETFERCSFDSGGIGVVFQGGGGYQRIVRSCRFTDLSFAGIWMHDTTTYSGSGAGRYLFGLEASDSRFERCGTGIHWVFEKPYMGSRVYLVRDTVRASSGDGIQLGPADTPWLFGVFDCLVEDNGGNGMSLRQDFNAGLGGGWFYSNYRVFRTRFVNNTGDGLFVHGSPLVKPGVEEDPGAAWRTKVAASSFIGNGGHGVHIDSPTWRVDSCLAMGNGRDGFSLRASVPVYENSAAGNTAVLNHGDGFRFTVNGPPADSLFFIERNLAVMNTGAGIRVPFNGGLPHFAFNDAWNNYLAQHIAPGSPADSNLTVNPRFCDLGAGDLGLEQGSPCGPGGLYGLIGALPESCPNTLAVEPEALRLSFTVRPTVARGSVEFVPPSLGPDGRVELFDLSGRRLWGAAFGPTTGSLWWQGQSETGHAQPGLYWVRFTCAGETQSQRLVWLR